MVLLMCVYVCVCVYVLVQQDAGQVLPVWSDSFPHDTVYELVDKGSSLPSLMTTGTPLLTVNVPLKYFLPQPSHKLCVSL